MAWKLKLIHIKIIQRKGLVNTRISDRRGVKFLSKFLVWICIISGELYHDKKQMKYL